jgi:hypothetical protein
MGADLLGFGTPWLVYSPKHKRKKLGSHSRAVLADSPSIFRILCEYSRARRRGMKRQPTYLQKEADLLVLF